MAESKYRVELVEKTFAILECFDDQHRELSGREITRATGHSQSSVYRILSSLTDLGILEHDSDRRYRIGSKLYMIGSLAVLDVRTLAMPYMEELRRQLHLTVSLSTYDGKVGILVEVLNSRDPYGVSVAVGTREPLHCTASGKCALAFGSPIDRDIFLAASDFRAYTPATMTRRREIVEAIELVREQGYATDRGEWAPHVNCVAAPLFDRTQQFCGALTLSWPIFGPNEAMVEDATTTLFAAAVDLSKDLGFTGAHPTRRHLAGATPPRRTADAAA